MGLLHELPWLLATRLLGYTNPTLVKAINAGELIEINEDG